MNFSVVSVRPLGRGIRRAGRSAVVCAVGAFALSACNEQLDSSAGCPLTCSDPASQIQNITIDAIALDSTLQASAGIGTEQIMLLANRGDTLDTRLIFRFDTLPNTTFATKSATTLTPITSVDSVYLRLHFDSLAASITAPVTISLYDVSATGINDTLAANLVPLFTPSRLLGSRTLGPGLAVDTVSVQLDNAAVLNKIQNGLPLRIGVQVTSTVSVMLHQPSIETVFGARLSMRVTPDTGVAPVVLVPHGKLVNNDPILTAALADYSIIVAGTPPSAGSMLAIGGIPATRTYFRFNIPSRLIDSSIVVRATLLLTQVPSDSPDPLDTISVLPYAVVAGTSLTDLGRSSRVTALQTVIPFSPLKTFPSTSGVQEIEIAPAFALWPTQGDTLLPRAIVLESTQEGLSPKRVLFYSSEATLSANRPQLRVSYIPRSRVGTP